MVDTVACTAPSPRSSTLTNELCARTLGADRHRRGETNLVQAVVDCQLYAVDRVHLMLQPRQQRQGHVPVGDGLAERASRGPLRVDVDPLVIAGRIGEQVDVFLGDGYQELCPIVSPVAAARLATDSKVRMDLSILVVEGRWG